MIETREYPVPLTDEELKTAADYVGLIHKRIQEKDAAFEEIRQEYKHSIKELRSGLAAQLEKLSTRREVREVELEILYNSPEKGMTQIFLNATGALIDTVDMTSDDEQDLFTPDGTPLERVTRDIEKRRTAVRLTVPFPWERMGAAVIRWHAAKRIKGQEQLFIGRNQKVCYRHQQSLLQRAGLPGTGIGFHGLRKTCLLRFFNAFARKWDVTTAWRKTQHLAGHSRIDTTLIYLDADRDGAADPEIRAAWQN